MQLEIIKFFQSFSSPFLDWLFELITITAEENSVIIIASIFLWCINKNIGYKLGFIALSGSALNFGLKTTVKAPRPIGADGIKSIRVETAYGYSFPSGHTQGTVSTWLTIMLNVKNNVIYIIGACIILFVAISRLYLGVHWPIDVIGGILVGAIWVLSMNKLYDYSHKSGKPMLIGIVLLPMLLGLIIFQDEHYIKSCAAMLGFYLGYAVEYKYIKFNVNGGLLIQLSKLIIGLGILLGLKVGLKLLLPVSPFGDFIRYTIIGLWASAGIPFIFTRLLSKKTQQC